MPKNKKKHKTISIVEYREINKGENNEVKLKQDIQCLHCKMRRVWFSQCTPKFLAGEYEAKLLRPRFRKLRRTDIPQENYKCNQ